MKTRTIGELTVSVVGLGCNNFGRKDFVTQDLDGTRAVLDACVSHGITLLDTAALYGGPESLSESLMGEALEGRRDKVVLATKFGHTAGPEPESWGKRGSREFVRRACEASLTRLRTDRIDLYQMHEPDPETPIEETLGALAELREEGKVREIGSSNFSAAQIREAAEAAERLGVRGFVSEQGEYSLLQRDVEDAVVPALQELGIGLLPYFPLASGLLTGKYAGRKAPEGSRLARNSQRFEAVTSQQWTAVEEYQRFCDTLGRPMVEVTFAWLLAQDVVPSVIAGATTPEQVAANAAAGSASLNPDEVAAVSEIFT